MTTKLSVNINKIATLRNTRHLEIPSLTHLATLALNAGAHGITIHPRPDQRHIRAHDVTDIAALLKNFNAAASGRGVEFNIEGNPFHNFLPHIPAVRPTQCTLVPDAIESFTSNSGWILTGDTIKQLAPLIAEMKALGARVSLFMDPGSPDIQKVKDLGADRIELYTEPYAAAFLKGGDALKRSLNAYQKTAAEAHALHLGINAGHDLNLHNLPTFLHHIPHTDEVSIGHALIADALEFGMSATIKKYLSACETQT